MNSKIGIDSWIAAGQGQVSVDVSGEAVILNLSDGQYYGLNEVGARIWFLVQEPCSVSKICESLLREYPAVEPDRCQRETLDLIEQLVEARLVELVPQPEP